MPFIDVILLAVVQGLAELLPVSSSAHVIVAAKLLGLDPSSPPFTLLLVLLHTGTMFAVILYFWNRWRTRFFASKEVFKTEAVRLGLATALTAVVGYPIIFGIEHLGSHFGWVGHDADGHPVKAEVEQLFSNLALVAVALAAAGILITIAGLFSRFAKPASEPIATPRDAKNPYQAPGTTPSPTAEAGEVTMASAGMIGAIQGLCLPFRGFSRSGATISVGLLAGVARERAEEFSFALAVILTPPVVLREAMRLHHADHTGLADAVVPGLIGLVCSFMAGLVALKWLSSWLENGRWHYFGVYCLAAAAACAYLSRQGY